jgi:hypothetical protein
VLTAASPYVAAVVQVRRIFLLARFIIFMRFNGLVTRTVFSITFIHVFNLSLDSQHFIFLLILIRTYNLHMVVECQPVWILHESMGAMYLETLDTYDKPCPEFANSEQCIYLACHRCC